MQKWIVALVACGLTAAHAAPAPKAPALVSVQTAKTMDLFDILTFPARVTPRAISQVLAETDGVIVKINAPVGTSLKSGSKVLAIKHTEPGYEYAPYFAKSPITGVVTQLEVTEGTQIARGQKLATITDPTHLKIQIEIPAQDLSSLSTGLKGELKIPGKDDPYAVKIIAISPVVDPATGTATCELELAGAKSLIPPGSLGVVTLKTNQRKGIMVSEDLISYKGDTPVARILVDNKVKSAELKLGRKQRGQVEILTGVTDGATLIERFSRYTADGEEVKVQ